MKQSFSVIFRTIILFAFLLNINVAFGQKENLIDSLKNRLMEEMPDSTRFNTLILLGKEYFNTGKPEIAIEYANKAEKLEKKIKIELTGYQHYLLGRMYNELGLIDKSLSRFLSSIEGLRKTKNSEKLFDVYYRSANIYRIQFDFINELKILEEIKGYSEESGMIEELAKVYFEISNVYQRLNDFDQELVYLNKFSEISESLENDKLKSNVHYRKGEIHFINKEYSKAIEEYKNAIEYYPDDNLSPTIFAYLRIAFMYYLDKDLDNSLVIYEKVLLMCENTSRLNYLINAYGNLGTIYRDIGDYKKAEEYYLKAIDLAKNKDDYYSIWWIFKDMSIMYISKNDYKLAYKYYKLSEDYGNIIRDNVSAKDQIEGRTKYIEYKNQKELEKISQKLKTSRIFLYSLSVLIFLLFIIGFLLFRQNRLRTKQRIAAMSHKISEITQKNLRQQMNPHFIFNTLNSIQYYMFRNDKIATNNYLTKFSSLMRKTLENSEHTSITIKEEIEALELYLQLESIRFKDKFDYKISVDENIDSLVHKVPTMLIQPFVENSICHGINHMEGKGHIIVELKLEGDIINCVIEDNGVGRKKAMEIKNQNGLNHSSFGTSITENRLKLVSSLYSKDLQLNYIDLYNDEGLVSGTRVEILIPII